MLHSGLTIPVILEALEFISGPLGIYDRTAEAALGPRGIFLEDQDLGRDV